MKSLAELSFSEMANNLRTELWQNHPEQKHTIKPL